MDNDFIFLGDSLTYGYGVYPSQCWVRQLENDINMNIINKGINGNTTTDMLFRLDEDVILLNPKAVFIMGGTNDLLCNHSVDSIIKNIDLIIRECLNNKIEVYLGIPPTIIPEMANNLFMKSSTYDYCKKSLKTLHKGLMILCKEYDIKLVDFYSLSYEHISQDIFLDGIHLNSNGQNLLYTEATKILRCIFN